MPAEKPAPSFDGEVSVVDDDLRNRLFAMEAKLKLLRDRRQNHHDAAKRAADKRNAIQVSYKDLRPRLDEGLEKREKARTLIREHKARRDAYQTQLRELINQVKGKRKGEKDGKSDVIRLSEIESEIERLDNQIMTSGTLSLKKENEMLNKIKYLQREKKELAPKVELIVATKIDLENIDGTIAELKQEADNEHQLFVAAIKEADAISSELDEIFKERDHLKAEGDRHHQSYVDEKEAADEIHAKVVGLIEQVTEVRDEIKAAKAEAQSWIDDHNKDVRATLATAVEDESVADNLLTRLLEEQKLTVGGLTDETKVEETTDTPLETSPKQRPKRRFSRGPARGPPKRS